MAIQAKYSHPCSACGETYEVGDWISGGDGEGWHHAKCPPKKGDPWDSDVKELAGGESQQHYSYTAPKPIADQIWEKYQIVLAPWAQCPVVDDAPWKLSLHDPAKCSCADCAEWRANGLWTDGKSDNDPWD